MLDELKEQPSFCCSSSIDFNSKLDIGFNALQPMLIAQNRGSKSQCVGFDPPGISRGGLGQNVAAGPP